MHWLFAAAALLGTDGQVPAPQPSKPIEVMVVGTWHFANHNLDLHNITSEDVRSDRRQLEMQRVAEALEGFKPTKIVIEKIVSQPDLLDPDFQSFSPALLRKERSETIQLGFRIAHNLGLGRVYAINEQPSDGEPDYFPYGKVQAYAESHAQAQILKDLHDRTAADVKAFGERQQNSTMAELLLETNRPDHFGGIHAYYGMLAIGDTGQQPGADLNAMWYLRNAKIFAKLMTVAKPGDRILVVYGAGHAYWLRHFASETPGFANVDPLPYLRRAAAQR